ncbi:MAG: flagellar hook-associated protein FlgK [Candidatus Binatia bacterium]
MGILTTLSIASQSLKNQQAGIQTTGHNIANAATLGFSRQRVEILTEFPSFQGGVMLGQGSKVVGVQRVVDRFLEAGLLTLNRDIGTAEAEHQAMAAIQEIFPTTGGIDAALSVFFGSLSDLANNPGGLSERVSVVGKATAVGESLRHARELLASSQRNLDDELESITNRVNLLTQQIAELNGQISFGEIGGVEANDFRDQRQTRIQELVRLTGATVREGADGQVAVISNGLLLVSGTRPATLDSSTLNGAGFRQIMFESPDGLTFDASTLFQTGKIGTVLEMRDNRIQDIIDRVDQIAVTLVNAVNAQHASGFDLSGVAGGDFFTPMPAVAGAAAVVRVNSALASDPRLIAAASSANTVPGDNRNALALLNLRSVSHVALGDLTLQDGYLALVGDIGSQVESAQMGLDFRQSLLMQTQAKREAVSGVNMDEEMTKMILFQRAFEASSLLVRAADDMYGELIEMTR